MKETFEKGMDKDLGGRSSGEVYSMTGNSLPRDASVEEGEFYQDQQEIKNDRRMAQPGHLHLSKNDIKTIEQKKNKQIVTWRIGVGLLVILLIAGSIYFVVKGVNWGVSKVAGNSPTAAYVPSLRSNADPRAVMARAPVISEKNIYPVGTLGASDKSPGVSSFNNSTTGRVAGSTVSAIGENKNNPSTNCPDYLKGEYYFCEWVDGVNFRPYRTQEEYLQTKSLEKSELMSGNYYTPQVTASQQYATPSSKAGVNCPEYAANEYDYCEWRSATVYRGFNYGE